MVLLHQLKLTAANTRDIRTLLHGSKFQQISDRNSERLFFRKFLFHQDLTSIYDRALPHIHQINVGNLQKAAALSANTNTEELADPVVRKLFLMIKKSRLSKTCFIVVLRELSLQKENF
jgi:hypothetical protein